MSLQPPSASDGVEKIADWLEFTASMSPEGQVSLETLVSIIRSAGSVDAFDERDGHLDHGSEASQSVASDAFSELSLRSKACQGRYPFEVEQGLLRVKQKNTPYNLLLLLSFANPTTGHSGTAVLFERLCTLAAHNYFGGKNNNAEAIRFGSPRKVPLAKFSQAIDNLCGQLGEGVGCKEPSLANHTGDQGLDIVAWKHFPDRKPGKLVAFGQCSSGSGDWTKKLNELDGTKFSMKWLQEQLLVPPIRFFFVPRRIANDHWRLVGIDAGIVFDRCRIVSCLPKLDATLKRDCSDATKKLITQLKNGK